MRAAFLLLLPLLAGCDKLTGAADQKIADAEAIGYACRVSHKTPEDCMKENEAHPPSSILDGWKTADEEIKEGKLDPSMGNTAAPAQTGEGAAAEGEKKPTADETGKEGPKDAPKDAKTDKPAAKGDKAAPTAASKDTKPAEHKDEAAH